MTHKTKRHKLQSDSKLQAILLLLLLILLLYATDTPQNNCITCIFGQSVYADGDCQCGNTMLDAGEQCDDGNQFGNDFCSYPGCIRKTFNYNDGIWELPSGVSEGPCIPPAGDGCPDATCSPGENCPDDASACTDNICYEPTCTNGCGEESVASGNTDEACYDNIGCAGGFCECDGEGICISNPPCGDGTCASSENCPDDASGCADNMCYEPTCTNGCGEELVGAGLTDEACYNNIGCVGGFCECDGGGICISNSITMLEIAPDATDSIVGGGTGTYNFCGSPIPRGSGQGYLSDNDFSSISSCSCSGCTYQYNWDSVQSITEMEVWFYMGKSSSDGLSSDYYFQYYDGIDWIAPAELAATASDKLEETWHYFTLSEPIHTRELQLVIPSTGGKGAIGLAEWSVTGADLSVCQDNKCYHRIYDGTGCSQIPVIKYGQDEACYNNIGCSGDSCFCDGSGNCISNIGADATDSIVGGGTGTYNFCGSPIPRGSGQGYLSDNDFSSISSCSCSGCTYQYTWSSSQTISETAVWFYMGKSSPGGLSSDYYLQYYDGDWLTPAEWVATAGDKTEETWHYFTLSTPITTNQIRMVFPSTGGKGAIGLAEWSVTG